MDIRFDFEHLSFLSNYQTNEQYSKLGFGELFAAAQMSGGDHSHFFNGFGLLITALEQISGKEMDLDDLLSLRSDNGVPSAVYGGALQVHPELGLCLSFGANHFPVSQSGKNLSIDRLQGELKLKDDNKREDQTTYCTLYWEVAINDDYDVFFAIPIKKDPADPKGEKALSLSKDIFKKEIVAKNNLVAFVREQSAGGNYTNYGNCPRVEGLGNPLKPATMEDGTYILVGIAHGVNTKKEDGKEFDSVIGYLADGTRIALNSYAKKDFVDDLKANADRLEFLKKALQEPNNGLDKAMLQKDINEWKASSFRFPLQWKMHHLDASRTRSTLCNISAPTTAKTQLPARFAAFANAALPSAPAPVKSALVGGSSADFERLETEQKTARAINPDGSSADDKDDKFF
jgi:hypothetical protein